jgi:aconitate hydratase
VKPGFGDNGRLARDRPIAVSSEFIRPLPETSYRFFDARAALEARWPGSFAKLPYAARILAENVLRKAPLEEREAALEQIAERRRDRDIPWHPHRIVGHDILGLTALVDLAGLRDVVAERGGDPLAVDARVPVELIVDHSLTVEYDGADPEALAKNQAIEARRNADRFDFLNWAAGAFRNVRVIPPGYGIMHQINLEKLSPVVVREGDWVFPDTCIGTDSHTPHVNALGVIAVGVGGLEAENVMLGHPTWMRLPEFVRVELTGRPPAGITATDIVLALTEFLRRQKVIGAWLEFTGEGARALSIGDRASIANMAPEYGATVGLFPIDERTLEYLRYTGREPEQVKLVERYAKAAGLWADALAAAEYDRSLRFDLSGLGRVVAGPSRPHAKVPTRELAAHGIAKPERGGGPLPDGAVVIAAITSCTNTSNPRNVLTAALLARKARERGLRRQPWVKTSFAPGSRAVAEYLRETGLLRELEALGFGIVGFACTTCNGMSGPLFPEVSRAIREQGVYAVAVLSGNRNFDGRIHPEIQHAFLASPPLVIAYAIAGSIRVDIENEPLAKDASGRPVYLCELWPEEAEIEAALSQVMKPEHYQRIYEPLLSARPARASAPARYPWRPESTYIRRPPYWDPDFMPPPRLKGMRPLAILGDHITTDHISPSNAITRDSAAGEYLAAMGLSEEDFNSYATHRGDHLTAMRATFANPKLMNEMVRNPDGSIRQGSLARLEPEGEILRMWEAIERYRARRQPLIIIAGAEYGQGSSRDWAAKGPRLAGVEVVLAESFERIHRSNLVGMGILPIEFLPGSNRRTLGLDGSELYDLEGEPAPGAILTLRIRRRDGREDGLPVRCRLDTDEELRTYRAGGILLRFAAELLAGRA